MVKIATQSVASEQADAGDLWGDESPATPPDAAASSWCRPAAPKSDADSLAQSLLEPGEMLCPLTGEIIDTGDIDAMIDAYERDKNKNDQIYTFMLGVRNALAAKTEGDAKTRRVRGKRRVAKIEMPDDSWDQSILKELWNSHAALAQQYMSIGTLNVKVREFKKLVNTSSDDEAFVFFRDAMTRANRGPTGTPTIKIET